jgi:signal peptidase II
MDMLDKSSHAMDPRHVSGPAARHGHAIQHIVCLLIVVMILAGDQITKILVQRTIPHDRVIPLIPGFFNLIHTENSGIAFSLFAGASYSWKMALMIGVSVALLITVVVVALKSREMNWVTGVGLALVLGGASSNLLDRIRFGQVVDFLDFYYRSYHWATFNVADSAIVAGAGLLLLEILLTK